MPEKKLTKRQAQGAETKRKLYEIAERLFTERNFQEVNVQDITAAAGITKGGFYVHFESKDALITELISDYTLRADAQYRLFLDNLPADMKASEILLALTEKIADALEHTIGLEKMRKVYQVLLMGSPNAKTVNSNNRELYQLVKKVLEKGIHSGEFKSTLSVDILAWHFVTAFRGISYEWCTQDSNVDLKAQSIEHIKLLLTGIMA